MINSFEQYELDTADITEQLERTLTKILCDMQESPWQIVTENLMNALDVARGESNAIRREQNRLRVILLARRNAMVWIF